MVMRPMVVRRRPLLRAAAIGGTFAAGRAMGRRSQEQAYAEADENQARAAPPPAGADTPPAGGSMMDQLNQLTALHEQGALSDEEFAAAKAKILGG
jgi:Short C-terminal domain